MRNWRWMSRNVAPVGWKDRLTTIFSRSIKYIVRVTRGGGGSVFREILRRVYNAESIEAWLLLSLIHLTREESLLCENYKENVIILIHSSFMFDIFSFKFCDSNWEEHWQISIMDILLLYSIIASNKFIE